MSKTFLNFNITQTIGTGTFGKVKKAQHVPTGQFVAIKLLNKSKILTEKDSQRVKRQIQILKSINHRKIIKLYQLEQTSKSYYLITQLVEGEQLFQKINRLGYFDEQTARTYFVQLLDAILYLKSKGICHRDIKPQNVIVQGDSLKLIDFGLSNYFIEGQTLQTSCGSPCYAAPEMMSQNSYDPLKTQIWALGVTLYAMLTGKLPFQHSNTTKLYKMMQKNQYEQIAGISGSLKSLLRTMIEAKPHLRITIEQLKQHPWIKSTEYNFQQEEIQQKWSMPILERICLNSKLDLETVKGKIQKQFGPQSSFYHLSLKKAQMESSSVYPVHRGPLHLAFIFPTLKAVEEEIARLMPYERMWTSISTVKTNKLKASIKTMPASSMFYLQLETL